MALKDGRKEGNLEEGTKGWKEGRKETERKELKDGTKGWN